MVRERDPLLAAFLSESEEILEELERGTEALGRALHDRGLLESLFRVTHTLKGGASCLAFASVTTLAHHLEAALEAAWAGRRAADLELVALALAAIDAMRRHVVGCDSGADPALDADEDALCQRLQCWADASARPPIVHRTPPAAATPSLADASPRGPRGLRVEVTRIDAVVAAVDALAARYADEPLLAELRALVLGLRRVPLASVFERLHRAVPDLAAQIGKQARLEVSCEDVEVDVAVAEALRGPLTHLVRNAVDHGLEHPVERARAGKPPTGLVRLTARREGDALRVELADDGAGLSRDRLLERGRRLGLPTDGLSDAQVWDLVFMPGLSTAERVTGLSGRGMGMDVVRRSLEAARGRVSLASVAGRGLTVTLRLPLA